METIGETLDITTVGEKDKRALLALARNSIEWFVKYGEKYSPSEFELSDMMYERCGVFVTLMKAGQLRGCIGYIEPIKEIWTAIVDNSINAAFYDPRFPPIKQHELASLSIEISLLSEVKRLDYVDVNDLLSKINRRMGLMIKKGMHSATYLPEVWEQFKDKDDFLESLCLKASLHAEAWRNAHPDISYYYTNTFKS